MKIFYFIALTLIGYSAYCGSGVELSTAIRVLNELKLEIDDPTELDEVLDGVRESPERVFQFIAEHGNASLQIIERIIVQSNNSDDFASLEFMGAMYLLYFLEIDNESKLKLPRQILGDDFNENDTKFITLSSSMGIIKDFGDSSDVKLVMPLVLHREYGVRYVAVLTLGKIGTLDDISKLEEALATAPPLTLAPHLYDSEEEKEDLKDALVEWEAEIQQYKSEAIFEIRNRYNSEASVDESLLTLSQMNDHVVENTREESGIEESKGDALKKERPTWLIAISGVLVLSTFAILRYFLSKERE